MRAGRSFQIPPNLPGWRSERRAVQFSSRPHLGPACKSEYSYKPVGPKPVFLGLFEGQDEPNQRHRVGPSALRGSAEAGPVALLSTSSHVPVLTIIRIPASLHAKPLHHTLPVNLHMRQSLVHAAKNPPPGLTIWPCSIQPNGQRSCFLSCRIV